MGSKEHKSDWIEEKVEAWDASISKMAEVARRQPQAAYIGLQRLLQAEWLFVQRVTAHTQEHFSPLDQAITQEFLPSLLGDDSISLHRRALMGLPIKQCVMTLPPPPITSENAFTTSRLITSHITAAVQAGTPYCRKVHLQMVSNTILRAKIQKDARNRTAKEVALLACGEFERRTIKQGAHTGAWLTITPTHNNGMMLSPGDWKDGCFLCNTPTPPHRLTPGLQRMWCTVLG